MNPQSATHVLELLIRDPDRARKLSQSILMIRDFGQRWCGYEIPVSKEPTTLSGAPIVFFEHYVYCVVIADSGKVPELSSVNELVKAELFLNCGILDVVDKVRRQGLEHKTIFSRLRLVPSKSEAAPQKARR